MRRILAFTLVLVLLVSSLTACKFLKSDEDLIRDRIDEMISNYNAGDLEGVIDCFDSSTRSTFNMVLSFAEAFGGELLDMDDLNLSDLFGLSMGILGQDEVLKADIQAINIQSDTRASVTLTLRYDDTMNNFSESMTMDMVKEDGDWFISVDSEIGGLF